jgi:hypothetical protein
MPERILIAICVGLAQAVLVWTLSTLLHTPRIWPGTILGFAMGTASALIIVRRRH